MAAFMNFPPEASGHYIIGLMTNTLLITGGVSGIRELLKDQACRNYIEASIPMNRVGQANEVADAILWLLSDQASFITGAMLDTTGGGYIL
jgi:enoyl-[acyl-carrier-protein] reductase (NADH)